MRTTKGFTLIELLVVIAIIGLLSSVVLASLQSARAKARDTAIMSEVRQLGNLMNLEYLDSKSYQAISPGWMVSTTPVASCASVTLTGTYATRVRDICAKIASLTDNTKSQQVYMGVAATGGYQSFTIMVWLPYKARFLCLGHNGKTSSDATASSGVNGTYPGCYSDPANIP